jgi:hypothetical protein
MTKLTVDFSNFANVPKNDPPRLSNTYERNVPHPENSGFHEFAEF